MILYLFLISMSLVYQSGLIAAEDVICKKDYVQCNSTTMCIPESWMCDVWNDCLDNEDESNCASMGITSKQAFEAVDADGDSHVSFLELASIVAGMRDASKFDADVLGKMIKAADLSGDEKISFKEFPFLMAQIKIVKTDDKESMAHFNMFRSTDIDNDGFVSIDDVVQALSEQGTDVTSLEEQYIECDLDNDGRLNFKEYNRLALTAFPAKVEQEESSDSTDSDVTEEEEVFEDDFEEAQNVHTDL